MVSRSMFTVVCFVFVFATCFGNGLALTATDSTDKNLIARSADQCYGKRLSATCQPDHLLRIVSATYWQTYNCSLSSTFEPRKGCTREEANGAVAIACNGKRTCDFLAPWIHLSSGCGYSNSFHVVYQCIPEFDLTSICSQQRLVDGRGFVTSPGYPGSYASSSECSVTVVASPGDRINVRLIDIRLSISGKSNDDDATCTDLLWITEGSNRFENFCPIHRGRKTEYLSSTNQLTIHFTTAERTSATARGFWLYYETILGRNSPQHQTHSPTSVKDDTPLSTTNVLSSRTAAETEFSSSISQLLPVTMTTTTPVGHSKSFVWGRVGTKLNRPEPKSLMRIDGKESVTNGEPDAEAETIGVGRTGVEEKRDEDGEGDGVSRVLISQSLVHLLDEHQHPELIVEVMIPVLDQLRVESMTARPSGAEGGSGRGGASATEATPIVGQGFVRHHRSDRRSAKHNQFELSVMASAAGSCGIIIIIIAVVVGVLFYRRRRRKASYGEKITTNRSFKNVIFAFENDVNMTSPSSTPDIDLSAGQQASSAGGSAPHWDGGGAGGEGSRGNGGGWSRGAIAVGSREILLPIDEKMEDLYAEVKQCGLKADPSRIVANAEAIKARTRSKSADFSILSKQPPIPPRPLLPAPPPSQTSSDVKAKFAPSSSSNHEIQSLDIELLDGKNRAPWFCRSFGVGSVTISRDLPALEYPYRGLGVLGQDSSGSRARCWSSERWDRPPQIPAASCGVATVASRWPASPRHSIYVHCSALAQQLAMNPVVDMSYEATLLEHEDATL